MVPNARHVKFAENSGCVPGDSWDEPRTTPVLLAGLGERLEAPFRADGEGPVELGLRRVSDASRRVRGARSHRELAYASSLWM